MSKEGKYVYDWPRPMVTVDAIVFAFSRHRPRVLLIKRGAEPFQGKWAIPGGFVEMDEELEDAAARELYEETGLRDVPLKQMHTFGKCRRDPRGRQITIAFMGIAEKGSPKVTGGDDAAVARWFDIDNLPPDMAFDHNDIAQFAVRKLKKTAAYTQQMRKRAKP